MGYLFIPPIVEEGPMGGNWLFARYKRKQGVTVYRIDGVWYEDRFPSQDALEEADVVYLGGHEHYITSDQKDDLEDAGYTVITT